MSSQINQFCTFFVDQLYLGIDVQCVQEVIRYQTMTRVPLAPQGISGLINLRGQIVTAMDLRFRLDLPQRETGRQPINVVVRDGETSVSLLVDRIGDVVDVDDELFEPPPMTVPEHTRELILGAYKLPDQLLLILDTSRVLEESDARATEARMS